MAKLSQDELNKIKAELKAQADLQQRINENAGDYLKLIKEIKELQKSITTAKTKQAEQDTRAKDASKAYQAELAKGLMANDKILKQLRLAKDIEKAKLKILTDEVTEIERMTGALVKQAKEASKVSAIFTTVKKDIGAITKAVNIGYGKLKSWAGAFDMDKSIRMSATQMGVLSKQTDTFRNSLDLAASQTASFGVGIGDLAKMQAEYSTELGRTVMLGQQGLEAMAQMAASTVLGADGAAKMAADMDNQGYSAERTRDFVEQTLNDSHKMGINASKVIKNISSNMKMLNKYNFKGGVKGLAKMAATVSKLGVDMNFVSGMAEKLFDIEGAVDMSAQLQVMGGEWAKLADPFKLMYMARNDMEGLTAAMGKAAEASVHFNKANGEFEISAMEMHKLRKVAEQTGVEYDDLAKAGKNAAKATQIKKQMSISVDKETQEFLANTAKFNAQGDATIEIKGETKLLKSLSSANVDWLKAGIKEKESLKQRAEASQTFDEKLGNVVMQLKQMLLPFVKALDEGLRPVVQKLTDALGNPEVIKGIKSAAETAGKAIAVIGRFIAENPGKAMITAIAGMGLLEAGKWFLNGMALGKGFNVTASATGGGGGVGSMLSSLGGGLAKTGGGSMLKGAAISGGLGIGGALLGSVTDANTDPGSAMNILGTAAADAMNGAALGSFLGPIGAAIGGVIGGVYGGITAYNSKPEGQHDAFIGSPIHDGSIPSIGKGLGSDFSKDRGIVQGGKITPIDNKDDLMAFKPKGPVDNALKSGNSSQTMKIEFGEIHFRFDELKVSSPGSPGVSIDLLKDQNFIRSITRMVHSETEKVINGGKNKG